jgi:periplasmic protein CpxP/Spy
MNTIRKTLVIACATLYLGLGSVSNMAVANDNHGQHSVNHARMQERMQAHHTQKLAQLHDKLNLQMSQEPAWTTFVTSVTPPPRPTPEQRAELDKLTAPERGEHMLEQLKQHEVRAASHLQALKTFYAQLSTDQKKIFDDNFKPMHRRHHGPGQAH